MIRSGFVFVMDSLVVYWDMSVGYIDCGINDFVVDVGWYKLNV